MLFVVRFVRRWQVICYVTPATRTATLKPFIDPRKAKPKTNLNHSPSITTDNNSDVTSTDQ